MQEETIKFLTEHKKYRVLWWGFGPTLLEDLCRKKKFDVTEFLVKRDKYQCTELMIAFGERKIYWWWTWSKKIEDITFDEKSYRRVCEYHKYSWFWQIILGLFTPVLVHRKIVKWINIECKCGGYMLHRDNNHDNAGYLTEEQPTVDFNTVGGTLKSLGFPGLLKQLDDSLELVRKNMRTEEQHRQFVAEIDKKIKKSSLTVHSDKVNAGDDKQAALNACRVLIKNTDELFLGYIYIDFQYGWYSRMKINSLGNIKVLNKLNSKILLELSEMSKVKQEEIITNINEFLKASDNSLKSFVTSKFEKNSEGDFERHRSATLNYLTLCIKGHENLQKQCNNILRRCLENI